MLHTLALMGSLVLGQVGSFSDGPISHKDGPAYVSSSGAAFTTLAINTAKTTDPIKIKGYRWVKFQITYAFGAATAVNMTCQTSEDGATGWSDIHVLQYASFPTATSAPAVWSYPAGAAKSWEWTVPVRAVFLRCTFVGTGSPTASDTLTVVARAGY